MPFTCPRCGRTSHNPNDEREGYCGACHDYTGGGYSREDVVRSVGEPHDDLTRIAGRMTDGLDDDIRAVAMLYRGDRAGICIHGYDNQTDALVDIFEHLTAIFAAQGMRLELIPVPNSPADL